MAWASRYSPACHILQKPLTQLHFDDDPSSLAESHAFDPAETPLLNTDTPRIIHSPGHIKPPILVCPSSDTQTLADAGPETIPCKAFADIVDGLSFCHQAPPVPLTSDVRTYLLSTVVTIQSLAPGAASPCHSFREATTQPVSKPPHAFNAICCHNWDAALSPHTARSALSPSLTHGTCLVNLSPDAVA